MHPGTRPQAGAARCTLHPELQAPPGTALLPAQLLGERRAPLRAHRACVPGGMEIAASAPESRSEATGTQAQVRPWGTSGLQAGWPRVIWTSPGVLGSEVGRLPGVPGSCSAGGMAPRGHAIWLESGCHLCPQSRGPVDIPWAWPVGSWAVTPAGQSPSIGGDGQSHRRIWGRTRLL